MNNKSFLDEVNSLSKSKGEVEQEILAANRKYCEGCANFTLDNIKENIKSAAKNGKFTDCCGKKRITFCVRINDYTYSYDFEINSPLISRGHIAKMRLTGDSHFFTATFNIDLIRIVFDYLKNIAANEGIICEAVKIRHKKKIYSGWLSGNQYKETLISYYELSDNKKYIEYNGGDEEYDLVVEGYIEY